MIYLLIHFVMYLARDMSRDISRLMSSDLPVTMGSVHTRKHGSSM